jgi:ribonuclease BN (tRNA processing enzyme)
MNVILLGTGGYHPSERRHTSCVMLPAAGIVLDAGTAMFRVARYLQTRSLDILISHAHLDHVVGLTYLLNTKRCAELDRITVHADAHKIAAIKNHLFAEEIFPARPPFEFSSLGSCPRLSGDCQLTWFPLAHPGGAVGFRLDWPDRALAYVTDTTAAPDAPYVEAVRGVNLLIHECYFADQMGGEAASSGHSCATPVARLASAAGVEQLVLVHLNPLAEVMGPERLASLRKVFPQTLVGDDGMELEF